MRRKGFACPTCGAPTRVKNTRQPQAGLVVRYRYCDTCEYRATTEERIAARRHPRERAVNPPEADHATYMI